MALCGIDFGTDNCLVAGYTASVSDLAERPRASVIVNELGGRTTPSWVQCPDGQVSFSGEKKKKKGSSKIEDKFVVGSTARSQARRCAHRTVAAAKLALGRSTDHPYVKLGSKRKIWRCGLSDHRSDSSTTRAIFDVRDPYDESADVSSGIVKSELIASKLLLRMRSFAASFYGEDLKGAVISTPPDSTAEEQSSLLEAARIAGLKNVEVLRSDIAIALAHGMDCQDSTVGKPAKRVLVLDVGACRTTASLLISSRGILRCVDSHTELGTGGWFIDDALVSLCARQFRTKTRGLDVFESRKAVGKLRVACEKAKMALSSAKQASIDIDALHEGIDFRFQINRARFDAEVYGAIAATVVPAKKLLAKLNFSSSDVHVAIVAGGSAHIPRLRQCFRAAMAGEHGAHCDFGSEDVDPGEAVALGCALHAAILRRATACLPGAPLPPPISGMESKFNAETRQASLNMLAAPLSIETFGGALCEIFPAGTILPTEFSFSAEPSLNDSFAIAIFAGKATLAANASRVLHRESSTKTRATVTVLMRINDEGTLSVSAEQGDEIVLSETCQLGRFCSVNSKLGELTQPLRAALVTTDEKLTLALAAENTEDLEEEDVARIRTSANSVWQIIAALPNYCSYENGEDIAAAVQTLRQATYEFDNVVGEVLGQYEEDTDSDEEDIDKKAEGGGIDEDEMD